MAEIKNPIAERVKKMAAILAAAQKVSRELKAAREREAAIERASPGPRAPQSPS